MRRIRFSIRCLLNAQWLTVFLFMVGPVMVLNGQSNQPQLNIQIESFPGVHRVVATTSNKKPVTADLELQVVGIERNYRNSSFSISVDLVIPAGSFTGSTELPILTPNDGWFHLNLHVEQDRNGAYGSRDFMSINISPNFMGGRNNIHHLFVSSNLTAIPNRTFRCSPKSQADTGIGGLSVANPAALPSFQHLADMFEDQNSLGTVTNDIAFLQNANEHYKSIHPNDFFEKWTSLSLFQSVLISQSDLKLLHSSPARFGALKKWIVAGGNVLVFDSGKKFENRAAIVELLTGKSAEEVSTNWEQASKGLNADNGAFYWSNSTSVPDASTSPLMNFSPADDIADQTWLKTGLMQGSIFVIASDMTDWTQDDWQSLYSAVQLTKNSVVNTLGAGSFSRSYDPNFAIPGIGKPPVLAFQILIGLFVTVIGPGFYFFFNATGRLYLLLISTPLFALAVVLALFAYGIISDGFAIQGRVASVTQIDHSTSAALTHARHTFYSGVAPRECLFNDEALVVDSRSDYSSMTRFRIGKDRLSVSGGQIKARSPFQLTSLASFETDRKLAYSRGGPDKPGGTIANEFADPIELAVVHTEAGWFLAENVQPQTAQTARPTDPREFLAKIRALSIVPLPVETRRRTGRNRFRGGYWDMDDSPGGWGRSAELISKLEMVSDDSMLPVGSYVALMRTNQLVADPQPKAIYGKQGENRLHVIIGKW